MAFNFNLFKEHKPSVGPEIPVISHTPDFQIHMDALQGKSVRDKIHYIMRLRTAYYKPGSFDMKPLSVEEQNDYDSWKTMEDKLREMEENPDLVTDHDVH